MTQHPFSLPVDKTLTVDNARQRRYTLVCDLFPGLHSTEPGAGGYLAAEGGVLRAGSAGNRDEALGLYQPLRQAS